MNLKTLLHIVYLIITVGFTSTVYAVTDAELKVLEKQIEQQETEAIKQVEDEAKAKTELEAKRKAIAETKKKTDEEKRIEELEKQLLKEKQKRLTEQGRIKEEKRKAGEARLTELDKQRKEEEAKLKVEEEKKEKYNLLLSNGRDLALIKEGATSSIPVGEDPSSSTKSAIDGNSNNYGPLHGYTAHKLNLPGSHLLITLKEVSLTNKIRFLLWDKDNRFYRYKIEVSNEQKQWELISNNNSGEPRSWQEFVFEPKEIKFIKITGLFSSATFLFSKIPWFHVVEVETYGLPLSEIK